MTSTAKRVTLKSRSNQDKKRLCSRHLGQAAMRTNSTGLELGHVMSTAELTGAFAGTSEGRKTPKGVHV
jgi:hypothetical protein